MAFLCSKHPEQETVLERGLELLAKAPLASYVSSAQQPSALTASLGVLWLFGVIILLVRVMGLLASAQWPARIGGSPPGGSVALVA